jgi:hypothetical protein
VGAHSAHTLTGVLGGAAVRKQDALEACTDRSLGEEASGFLIDLDHG